MTELHPPEPVASFIDAVNRHDECAVLDAFAPGGYVDDWGRMYCGRDQIKAWSDSEFVGTTGTLRLREVDVEGDVIMVVVDWTAAGAEELSRFEFVPEGRWIASMTIREG
ncbi:nuclear transport factor 2 family protein [Demequina sp. SO4-18]|uniref:nuclear transport factor 2 family protein n=1 Tax=Demequina sp. SO4-18 TaxID=3401026 RepID=UPI003B5910E6